MEEKQEKKKEQKWVKSYSNSLCKLSKLDMTLTEMRIVLYLASLLSDHNMLISMSQSRMAKELNIKQPNISYAFKQLKEKGILIQNEPRGHLFLNANIFQFGNYPNQSAFKEFGGIEDVAIAKNTTTITQEQIDEEVELIFA